MAVTTVIKATTAAVLTGSEVKYNTHGLVETCAFLAKGLAGAEKITPLIGGSNGWQAIFEDGVQVFLTATSPQISVLPGGHYGFIKDATAAAASLDALTTK